MRKTETQKTGKGFVVKKSTEYIEKQEREQRIQEKKQNRKAKYTNEDVMEMLMDIADRQAEIYDMLKQNTK